jgi:glycosyltransferase involved in cell wall biosynthesis
MKKTILHIINNLGRGGAERMLVTVVKELKEYNNIIVTLDASNSFEDELECDKYICINMPSPLLSALAAIKLRGIINEHKPDIVHSHLFWPTFIARMATPKKIPLITTIHAFVATSTEYQKRHIKWLDKISYHFRKSSIIAVAKGALKEYFSFLHLKPYRAYSLYTFVDTRLFNDVNTLPGHANDNFRLITIGTLKEQKNHQFLVNAFKQLKNEKFELHIYGTGTLKEDIEKSLRENNITNVVLKGMAKNIHQVIKQYDLFVMSSKFEGFSLAVLEGMALQMPMLLSDIDSFREQCEDTAEYFSLKDTNDFVIKLKQLSTNQLRLQQLGSSAKQRVMNNFTLEHHMSGLRNIYLETLSTKK